MSPDPRLKAYTVQWETTRGVAGFHSGTRRICAISDLDVRAIAPQLIARDLQLEEASIKILAVTLQGPA